MIRDSESTRLVYFPRFVLLISMISYNRDGIQHVLSSIEKLCIVPDEEIRVETRGTYRILSFKWNDIWVVYRIGHPGVKETNYSNFVDVTKRMRKARYDYVPDYSTWRVWEDKMREMMINFGLLPEEIEFRHGFANVNILGPGAKWLHKKLGVALSNVSALWSRDLAVEMLLSTFT